MASKTASLIIRLTDQVSGPAKQAAGALKGLAGAGDGLSKLKNAANGLDQLGAKMRAAKSEVEKAAKELAAAEKKVAFFARSKASGSENYVGFVASGMVAEAQARLRVAKQANAQAQRQYGELRATLGSQKAAARALATARQTSEKQAAVLSGSVAKAAPLSRTAADLESLLPKGLGKSATVAAAGLAQVTTQAKATRAAVQQLAAAPPPFSGFSEGLKRDLAALDLTRGQVRALARDFTRMRKEQVAALGPINPRYHGQILEADRGKIEDRLRERARRMAEEAKVAAALAPGQGGAREKLAAERLAAAESVRVAREAAREKLQVAREAARAARQAERAAAQESSQAAREAARAAREAAREKIAAAREAARAVKAAAREEAAALRAAARERTRLDRESRRFRGEAGGHARAAAGAIGLGGGAYGASRLATVGARNAGERATETARGRAVGLTPAEDKLGEARAYELSRQFPSLDPTGLRELYRALHVNLGGNAAAASDTLEPVARAQVLLQNFRKREEAQADLARIIRGAENAGFGDKPEKFTDYLQGAIKGMQLFGDTLRGEDYYQYAKTGRLGSVVA